ncbi:MAG: phosphatidylglycerophosphatase A [Gammaproteobacteria bacterium]|nr:phosphatidylglycerophosphatase A [Gammaproteobacteria bacterium]
MSPTFGQLLRDPVLLLAFGFGSGLAPKAPGTFGTAAALLLWLPVMLLPFYIQAGLVLAVIVVGSPICGIAARRLGVHDHGGIVWDEFAGLFLTILLMPTVGPPGAWLAGAFLAFRFFDIVKPWPIRWLDRQVGGGTGIMVDDLVAALFAAGLLHIAALLVA